VTGRWAADKPDLQTRFAASSSPSYRLVVDMKNIDSATIIDTTGQSGVPFDSHYGDFIQAWLSNSPFPLPFSNGAVDSVRQTDTDARPLIRGGP
jgi:penicillin amidase